MHCVLADSSFSSFFVASETQQGLKCSMLNVVSVFLSVSFSPLLALGEYAELYRGRRQLFHSICDISPYNSVEGRLVKNMASRRRIKTRVSMIYQQMFALILIAMIVCVFRLFIHLRVVCAIISRCELL